MNDIDFNEVEEILVTITFKDKTVKKKLFRGPGVAVFQKMITPPPQKEEATCEIRPTNSRYAVRGVNYTPTPAGVDIFEQARRMKAESNTNFD